MKLYAWLILVILAFAGLFMSCSTEIVPPQPVELFVVAPSDTMEISVDGVFFGYGKAMCIVFENYPNLLQIGSYPFVLMPPVDYGTFRIGGK